MTPRTSTDAGADGEETRKPLARLRDGGAHAELYEIVRGDEGTSVIRRRGDQAGKEGTVPTDWLEPVGLDVPEPTIASVVLVSFGRATAWPALRVAHAPNLKKSWRGPSTYYAWDELCALATAIEVVWSPPAAGTA